MTVGEQSLNLLEYMPFSEGTKAAFLDKPSALQLRSELPRIDGATAFYPLYASFVQAVYPKDGNYHPHAWDSLALCSTTSRAYDSLLAGEADIIFCFEPSEYHRNTAAEDGITLQLTPIGREAFVFFVNQNNPVESITSGQVRDIYSGRITNWQELGGRDENIRAYQRRENSGSQTTLIAIMGDDQLIDPPTEHVFYGMSDIIKAAASYRNYENAVGFSFLFYCTEMVRNSEIKLLAIDGVYPSKETIQSGDYPFVREIYAVTAGDESSQVRQFKEWILSKQGQYLVKQTGYIPVK
ncbi:PstS family phosphate ABC transporter substrate-binding protein [Breznakiella homolactica]|uniref:Substrate-binding domain-containing protein n=1 Tax=Breznakiella homolactica TaxID=2798577 RepID=A0A7T7XPA5_9SPIR|nr:substrate-binding domain-containing protein [Breznakiella homolactica]QQO09892.1 substrate-binding domain-containing protein [Breznakiella homolactica]